jgi:hypothetical protein
MITSTAEQSPEQEPRHAAAGNAGVVEGARGVARGILDRDPGWTQDLVTLVVIFVAGLIVALLGYKLGAKFGVKADGYEVHGAIGGAFITWSALFPLFLKLRGSSRVLEDLRAANEDLRQKLLRGSPCPIGFTLSLDENQKIILARPSEWEPQGGVIFDFKETRPKPDDLVPANFRVYYYPADKNINIEAHYEQVYRQYVNDDEFFTDVTQQRIHIGGEPTPIECLQLFIHAYLRVSCELDRRTGQFDREIHLIPKEDFSRLPKAPSSTVGPGTREPAAVEPGGPEEWGEEAMLIVVRCVHKELKRVYSFDLLDNLRDVKSSTSKFNRALQTVRFLV